MKHFLPALALATLCLGLSSTTVSEQHPKLKALYEKPWGSQIDYVDLSNDGLTEVPHLSMYDIKNLNLSHNQIKEVAFRRLPHGVEHLNFSHNQLADTLYWDAIFTPQLRTLSLANNALTLFVPIIANMDTVDLSNNQLRHIVDIVPWGGGHGPFLLAPTAWKYLDVRGNPNLSARILCFGKSYRSNHLKDIAHDAVGSSKGWIYDVESGMALAKQLGITERCARND